MWWGWIVRRGVGWLVIDVRRLNVWCLAVYRRGIIDGQARLNYGRWWRIILDSIITVWMAGLDTSAVIARNVRLRLVRLRLIV